MHRRVIEAGDIDFGGHLVLDSVVPAIESRGSGPRGVLLVEETGEAARVAPALGLRVVLLGNFVADAPQDDARMIAVAARHVARIVFRPVGEVLAVAVGHLRHAPHIEGLVHHQQAEPVAVFENLRRRRVVAGAQRIDAGGFEDLQLAFDSAPVDGRAQRAEVVVVADALQFQVAAVQGEALLFIETNRANAERRGVAVHSQIVLKHLGHQRIEIGMVDIPALRLIHGGHGWDSQRSRPRAFGRNRHVYDVAAHCVAVGIAHPGLHRGLDLLAGTVA